MVKLLAGMDVEFAEALEELANVFDGGVSEDFRLAIVAAADALGEMRHEPAHLFDERDFGELHRFIEAIGKLLSVAASD